MDNTNDLYKCFITSVVKQNNCKGGIFIIPAGFFFSSRDIDVKCRDAFMKKYKEEHGGKLNLKDLSTLWKEMS